MPWSRLALLCLILAALLAGTGLLSPAATLERESKAPAAPRLIRLGDEALAVTAEAVLIKRLRTGEALFAKNADVRLPIASLTKLMTALLLTENSQPLAEIEFSRAAITIGEADDKRSSAAAGERFRAEDVVKMLLISSDNDAAYAAAEHVAVSQRPELASLEGRIGFFIGLMNERAAGLGLVDTHFANPAGFDHPENYSTAADLVRLAAAIEAKHPELWATSRTSETFVFGAEGKRHGLVNTDPLLREYPAIYGSKTGYEDDAKGALLILYQLRRDELFSIVLLRSRDRFGPDGDGQTAIQWLERNFAIEQ
ncbi:MAG: serine hydrolase [bacterium]|nr:serine hydrolase [bacterium]